MIRNKSVEICKLWTVTLRKGIIIKKLEEVTSLGGNIVWFEHSNYFNYVMSHKVYFSHVLYDPNVSHI